MLDDATEKGRQTNRKFIVLLLLLALAACFGAWCLTNWEAVSGAAQRIKNRWTQETPEWQSSSCTPKTKAVSLEGGICLLDQGTVSVLDAQGQLQYTLETEAELLCGNAPAAAYLSLGKTLYLLEQDQMHTLTISGGIDRVIADAGACVAVITADSGFLTQTEIYDTSGQLLGEIGLTDAAMVAASFLAEDQILAGLCVLLDGSWELRYYGTDGTCQKCIPLGDRLCQDLISCGSGVLVETEEELLFFSDAGTQTGSYTWGTKSLDALKCSQEGYAVLALSRGKNYELQTVGMDGSLLGQTQLDGPLRGLSVCGNTVCILDFEGLEVYDRHCEPTKIFPEGARAATVVAEEHACWLLGDGEIMHLGFA